ncbi:MAG: hypothetical protein IT269_02895, partial [Saprospiraceae bacterium]|nr:hypothetical protein [Saprospiraceae bacterium]
MAKANHEILKNITRPVAEGDVVGGETLQEAQEKTVTRRVRAKVNKEAAALEDIIERAADDKKTTAEDYLKSFPQEERQLILQILLDENNQNKSGKIHPDEELSGDWRNGG